MINDSEISPEKKLKLFPWWTQSRESLAPPQPPPKDKWGEWNEIDGMLRFIRFRRNAGRVSDDLILIK